MRIASLVLAALFLLAPQAGAQALPAAAKPLLRERQLVCRGAQLPAGWILVTDTRDASMCNGDQSAAAVNSYNIWAIERYDDKAIGAVMEVCASVPTPDGWQMIDVYRSRERCGHPDELFAANMKRIKRAR